MTAVSKILFPFQSEAIDHSIGLLSGQFGHVTGQLRNCSDNSAHGEDSSSTSDLALPPSKKRKFSKAAVERWIREYDRTLQTSVWIKYDMSDKKYGYVPLLKSAPFAYGLESGFVA